jgi:bifunctional DNase/RNase
MEDLLPMEVHGVNLDVMTNQPVVILREVGSKRFLPIWIGQFEATAILMEIQGVAPSRPLTHDLMKTLMDELHATLDRVVVTDLRDGTFYATLSVSVNGSHVDVDARPSDAIALAVRNGTPIFAAPEVMERAAIVGDENEEDEVERFREFLDTIKPEDFDA